MIWRTRSSPWERTRYFYGRPQERHSHRRRFSGCLSTGILRLFHGEFAERLGPGSAGWMAEAPNNRHLAYLPVNDGLARPDAPLTRGELAQMLYTLLDAGNEADGYRVPFSDTTGKDCAQAVAYLASYGILTGYADEPSARMRRLAGPRSPFCCIAVSLRRLWGGMGMNLCLRMFLPDTGPKRTYTARRFWAGYREVLISCSTRNAKSPVLKRSLPSTDARTG